jgi:hypothetical protein
MIGSCWLGASDSPTAKHAADVEQETEVSLSSRCKDPAFSIDQLVPFQRSASRPLAGGLLAVPTTTHAVGEAHETASAATPEAGVPFGAGNGWTDQLEPFHISVNAVRVAARQNVCEVHDTLGK